ncbi:MAG: hypothetical protein ACPLXO_03150 [Desulfurella sp.]
MKKIILSFIFVGIASSIAFAFNVSRNPFLPLVKTISASINPLSNATQIQSSDFTLKMVMWGSLKGALLQDASGMVYVVKQGTKIGQIQVIKILPNKVILKTPTGIKELSLQSPSNIISATKAKSNQNRNIQDVSNKTLSNEVKP